MFVGIDPGKNGAIATVKCGMWDCVNVPLIGKDYDMFSMLGLLRPLIRVAEEVNDEVVVILERAQAMPGQGVCSMFEFGRGYGLWQMALAALSLKTTTVHPRVWTKVMLLGAHGEGKERNINTAKNLFPGWMPKSKAQAIQQCDALLLAEYGRRLYGTAGASPAMPKI